MKDKGFIFDYAKCVSCHACRVACYNENNTMPPLGWRSVNSFNPKKIPLYGFVHLSLACNHCKDAPCLKACPAKAYSRNEITGAIIHNPKKCIGCRYCTWVCPFDAPKFNINTKIVEKCNFCNHLLLEGKKPSCANNCPTGALSYGEIEVEPFISSAGFSKNKIYPRVKTIRTEVSESIPEMDLSVSLSDVNEKGIKLNVDKKIDPISEWPLILFTLIASILAGWTFALNFETTIFINGYIFCILGLIGVALSSFHLGKPIKAIYSISNVSTSWLSREILFFSLFFVLTIIYFISNERLFFYLSIFFALLMLLSLELVYIPFSKSKSVIHSANTFLTALLFAFILSKQTDGVIILLSVKTLLYFFRFSILNFKSIFYILKLVRIVTGFFIPFILLVVYDAVLLAIPLITVGEVIDRFEFYSEIEIETPKSNLNSKLI